MDLSSIDFKHYQLLNIGGGNFDHRDEGWLNLDYTFEATARKRDWSKIDVVHNLMGDDPIPLPDKSLSGIYTEHTMEHLPYEKACFIFKEAHRLLKPGGYFRVSVPDAEKFYLLALGKPEGDAGFPSGWQVRDDNTKEQIFLDATCSPLCGVLSDEDVRGIVTLENTAEEAMLDIYRKFDGITLDEQKRRPGGHVSWWTFRRLREALFSAGFDFISVKDQGETNYKGFRKDYIDRTAPAASVRVEARK